MHKGKVLGRVIDTSQREGLDALRAQVAKYGNAPDGPIREILARLGDRWSPLILLVLRKGTLRFKDLQREIDSIADGALSQRILTLKLRALERDGIVDRHVIPTVPAQVEYSLTPFGDSLTAQLEGLLVWLQTQIPLIEASRERFDSE